MKAAKYYVLKHNIRVKFCIWAELDTITNNHQSLQCHGTLFLPCCSPLRVLLLDEG